MILQPRYLPRLAATIGLFTRYGLADFAKQQGLDRLSASDGPSPGDPADNGHAPSRERAAAFRRRLVELGPAYVKLGQVLSTRPDLLPDAYIEELQHLQDDVPPVPMVDVAATVEEELGGRLSKLFVRFDEEPLGSASLGQVHAAELRDGRSVVVKVQRPNIRTQLAEDIEYFRELAAFLSRHTRAGDRVDMVGVIHQLERALEDELDYRIEARNMGAFRTMLAEFPRLLIPRVVEGYTTERVLTTERITGVKITDVSPLARMEHDFAPLAEELTRAYLKQITLEGHFHADPHPGNVFIVMPGAPNPATPAELSAGERRTVEREARTPLDRMEAVAQRDAGPPLPETDVKLALIDFGMTARLSAELRDRIVRLLVAMADDRGDDAAEVLVEMGQELPGFDRGAYVRSVSELITRYYDAAGGQLDAGRMMYELINMSYRHSVRLPSELTLLAKTLFNLDSATRHLDPEFNPLTTVRDYANRIAAERAKRDLSPRRMLQLIAEGGDLLLALPHRLDQVSARLANNEFQLQVAVPQVTDVMKAFEKLANRVFSGLVIAGIIVASAMLYPHQRTLGLGGFVLAAVIGMYMVLSILWSDRHK